MEFKTNAAPYVRSKRSTLHIMLALCIALAVVWIFGIVYNFRLDAAIKAAELKNGEELITTNYGLRAILSVVVAVVISVLIDFVICLIKQAKAHKINWKENLYHCIHNYSYVTGAIFALTLPAYTSMYVVIIGSVFATLICKNCFGGFGKNVFNPAAMARIFVAMCFGQMLGTPEAIKLLAAKGAELYTVDAITGATVTTTFNNASNWTLTSVAGNTLVNNNVLVEGLKTSDLLLGNYVGALGETFTIVILVLGIALSVLKVINWRTPVFYLGTVALSALFIALFNGLNPGLYIIAHLSMGGLMFGAVFMLTDPVTGPTSNYGKIIAAVFAGFMTTLIRLKGGFPEGVVYSIAMANLISPAIDYVLKGRTNDKKGLKIGVLSGSMVVVILATTLIGCSVCPHKGLENEYGINYALEAKLQECYTLGEGEHFELSTKQPTTAQCTGYVYNAETNDKLDGLYLVKNEAGENTAYVAIVTDSGVAVTEYGDYPINNACAAITITKDNQVKSIYFLSPNAAGTGGAFVDMSKNCANNEVVGKTVEEVNALPDSFGGMSFSSKVIKALVADAKAAIESIA